MKTIDITIKQIQNKDGEYIAYVQSGFLAARTGTRDSAGVFFL